MNDLYFCREMDTNLQLDTFTSIIGAIKEMFRAEFRSATDASKISRLKIWSKK